MSLAGLLLAERMQGSRAALRASRLCGLKAWNFCAAADTVRGMRSRA
jgi:hypothetical protein